MNNLDKVKVLCTFLQKRQNVLNALQCLQAEIHSSGEAREWVRMSENIEVISTYIKDGDAGVRRQAMYCLSTCIAADIDSKLMVTKLSLFTDLSAYLEASKHIIGGVDQFVCIMLLHQLCTNNPCAQQLAGSTGCVQVLVEVFGLIIETCSSYDVTADSHALTFRRLVLHALKSTLSSPSHADNQAIVAAHPVFSTQVLEALKLSPLSEHVQIDSLCQLISSTVDSSERCDFIGTVASTLCERLTDSLSSSNLSHTTKPGSSIYVSVDALTRCLLTVVQSAVELSPVTQSQLDKLCPKLVKICTLTSDTGLLQSVLFLLMSLLDMTGSNHEYLIKSRSIKRLYRLTRSNDDPVIHCTVSYILLGLDQLGDDEMKVVRQLAPASLVRMGLPIDRAKEMTNGQHIVTPTRKQLFESNDIMELISSEEEDEGESISMSSAPHATYKSALQAGTESVHRSNKHWIQLTPPSRPRPKCSSSPGWRTRIRRLKSVLKQRSKRSTPKVPVDQENGCVVGVSHSKCSSKLSSSKSYTLRELTVNTM